MFVGICILVPPTAHDPTDHADPVFLHLVALIAFCLTFGPLPAYPTLAFRQRIPILDFESGYFRVQKLETVQTGRNEDF